MSDAEFAYLPIALVLAYVAIAPLHPAVPGTGRRERYQLSHDSVRAAMI